MDNKIDYYDFSCWVIKYAHSSVSGKTYKKDSLKNNDGLIVPLLWQHDHNNPSAFLGFAILEGRDEGVYMYGTFDDITDVEDVKKLLQNKGLVCISPYITQVEIDGDFITSGHIAEVSIIFDRVDMDEDYCPVMNN